MIMASKNPPSSFEFFKEQLARCLEEYARVIRECQTISILKKVFSVEAKTTSKWLDCLADSLIEGGVVVKVGQAFRNGLREISKTLGAMSWDALQKAYQNGGGREVIETLISNIGRAMWYSSDTLVRMLHEAVMGMLKAGEIIALKGAAGVLDPHSNWHWLTVAGGAAGYGVAAVAATPALPAIAAGAVVGTALVGVARWIQGS